jgi:hypothetical protein
MKNMARRFGVVASAVVATFGLYNFLHDCLILVHVLKPYGDGPAGVVVGPVLMVIGIVCTLWLLEKPLFPSS